MKRSIPHKLNARQVKEIREYYAAGETDETLAVWYEVGTNTIRNHTADIRRPYPRPKIDPAALEPLLAKGMTKKAIARHFKVSIQTVYNTMHRMGGEPPKRRRKITDAMIAEIREGRAKGMTRAELARRHNASFSVIHRYLSRAEMREAA